MKRLETGMAEHEWSKCSRHGANANHEQTDLLVE